MAVLTRSHSRQLLPMTCKCALACMCAVLAYSRASCEQRPQVTHFALAGARVRNSRGNGVSTSDGPRVLRAPHDCALYAAVVLGGQPPSVPHADEIAEQLPCPLRRELVEVKLRSRPRTGDLAQLAPEQYCVQSAQ